MLFQKVAYACQELARVGQAEPVFSESTNWGFQSCVISQGSSTVCLASFWSCEPQPQTLGLRDQHVIPLVSQAMGHMPPKSDASQLGGEKIASYSSMATFNPSENY